jgi:hypothetical protein
MTQISNRVNGHHPDLGGTVPPQNLDAERSALGAIIVDSVDKTFDDVAQVLTVDDLYSNHHRVIYRHICELVADGNNVDAVILAESLNNSGELEEIGGGEYLERLTKCVPHAAHAADYAKIVREKADLRNSIRRAREFIHAAQEPSAGIGELADKHPGFFKSRDGQRLNNPMPLDDLIEMNGSLRDPVVHGLFRCGEVVNVVASTKVGKSWGVYGMALSIITGTRWLDQFQCEPGRVLLIDNELHPELLASRIPTVADAMGIMPESYQNKFDVISLRGRLKDIFQIGPMIQRIPKGKYSLIIFDAMYRMIPAKSSENDNSNMTQIFNQLDRYAEQTDSSIILVHHSSKGSQGEKSVTDVGSGAGSQSRAADTHLILREHEELGHVVLDAVVRSFEPVEPLVLQWSFPLWVPVMDLDPEKMKGRQTKGESRQVERDREGMATIMKKMKNRKPATARQIRQLTGIGKERLDRLLGLLHSAGTITSIEVNVKGNETYEYSLVKHE